MSRQLCKRPAAPCRLGMTLIELMVAASVMSLVAIALGGLVHAVDTARTHIEGMQQASALGRFVVDRISSAVSRSGTYRLNGGPTVAGIAVIRNGDHPEILVVWTGGRQSSLASAVPLDRVPRANELIIYTPDPAAPERLVEIVATSQTFPVEFTNSLFVPRIRQIISDSLPGERVVLCEQVRVALVNSTTRSAFRCEIEASPADEQIASTPVGTDAWKSLPWHAGSCSSRSGVRQILVRTEIQILTQGNAGDVTSNVALPIFGAASRRYVFQKD